MSETQGPALSGAVFRDLCSCLRDLRVRSFWFTRARSMGRSCSELSESLQCRLQFLRMKSEWAGAAFVCHTTVFVDEVNSIRPAGIFLLRRVVEVIDQRGKLDAEFANAHTRNLLTFTEALRTGEDHVVAEVALHLPNVAGMRL